MRSPLREEILARAELIDDPARRRVRVLPEAPARELAAARAAPLRQVHAEALAAGVWPLRYVRNRDALSLEDQRRLLASCAAVVGLGGLGGQSALTLARIGVGRLILVDADRFDETNLNRQAFSDTACVGRPKSARAAEVLAAVNPGVEVAAREARLTPANAGELLGGAAVILDGLDNAPDRFALQGAARALRVPLVHAAVAGFEGRLMTVFPGDPGLRLLYPDGGGAVTPDRPEAVLGVPAPTPAVLASLQAAEAVLILLGRGARHRNAMLAVDLEAGTMERCRFDGAG